MNRLSAHKYVWAITRIAATLKIINEKTYFATNLITQINTQSKNIVGLIESRHSDDLIKKRRENTICFLIGQRCQGDGGLPVALCDFL